MRFKLLLLLAMVPSLCCAKPKAKSEVKVLDVELLGVDFSSVDIVGADDTQIKFHTAFEGINALLYLEPDKYDLSKFLNVVVTDIDTNVAVERIKLHTSDNYLQREDVEISTSEIISQYPKSSGNKLLVIAIELNKANGVAEYRAVIFNGEDHQIVAETQLEGKPGGFGLRNYWAGGLYSGLKNIR